jgi:hypothetical protein
VDPRNPPLEIGVIPWDARLRDSRYPRGPRLRNSVDPRNPPLEIGVIPWDPRLRDLRYPRGPRLEIRVIRV